MISAPAITEGRADAGSVQGRLGVCYRGCMYTADDPAPPASSHLRIARPSRDRALTERFWLNDLDVRVRTP
jgi:hypothetical protein